jgi:hypothetical protein
MQNPDVTTHDLNAALSALGASPSDQGTLVLIVARPTRDERRVLERGEITVEDGLVGDNWRARGNKDDDEYAARQITLMNSRVIQAIDPDQARWALAGDQLFVDFDLSIDNLPAGSRIAIGSAVLEISVIPHTGCARFTERFGQDAIRFVNSPEGRQARRRGANARVVQSGAIKAGDAVTKL